MSKLEQHYSTLRDTIEEQEATAALNRTRGQETVPDEIVGRLLGGETPIRVWREHRGLSPRELAARVAISPSALSDIETGRSEGRLATLRRIATALDVDLEDLARLEEDQQ